MKNTFAALLEDAIVRITPAEPGTVKVHHRSSERAILSTSDLIAGDHESYLAKRVEEELLNRETESRKEHNSVKFLANCPGLRQKRNAFHR